jgi:hypothetical protein
MADTRTSLLAFLQRQSHRRPDKSRNTLGRQPEAGSPTPCAGFLVKRINSRTKSPLMVRYTPPAVFVRLLPPHGTLFTVLFSAGQNEPQLDWYRRRAALLSVRQESRCGRCDWPVGTVRVHQHVRGNLLTCLNLERACARVPQPTVQVGTSE